MGSGYCALVMTNNARACSEVVLQTLPVEAEVGADAWIIRNSEIVIQKEFIDWFHEIEKRSPTQREKVAPSCAYRTGIIKN